MWKFEALSKFWSFHFIELQLVNYILNAKHGKKIAVILNEFGEEIGVERAMINEGEDGGVVEEWVELANGCVCCTVKHSLVQALEQLVQRKDRLNSFLLSLYLVTLFFKFVPDHALLLYLCSKVGLNGSLKKCWIT